MAALTMFAALTLNAQVKPGIEVLEESGFRGLEGKRVGLVTNPSGVDSRLRSTIDILNAAPEVNLKKLFAPEHGVRGDIYAGGRVEDGKDPVTGLPVFSVYGAHRKPTPEMLSGLDVVIYDIQDVGSRSYTFISTLGLVMRACAEQDIEVMVLDRPNPNGFYVDGPILQEEYKSGVGILPIPVVYGMTWGELAQMINGEGWLDAGKDACDLTVIPCGNYTHDTKTMLIKSPSPNIKDMKAVYLYASTCFLENTAVSVGRGTEYPFEIYGSPYLEGVDGFEFSFTPESIRKAAIFSLPERGGCFAAYVTKFWRKT